MGIATMLAYFGEEKVSEMRSVQSPEKLGPLSD